MEITGISFEYPWLLLFLLLVPVLIGAYLYNLKLKRKEALIFSNFEALEHVMGHTFLPPYVVQIIINIVIFVLLIFVAAGITIWYSGPVPDADFAILIDTSGSMSAEDIEESRMEAAKAVATSFVEDLPPISRVAVISFAGTPLIEQPLTDELPKAKSAIKNLELKPEGGTDIASALIAAANTLSISEKPKVVILMTDGSSTVGLSVKYGVDVVKSNHIIVHTIGIGSETGGNILNLEGGEKDTMLDEETLVYIAGSTTGTYRKFTNKETFKINYEELTKASLSKIYVKLSPIILVIIIVLMGVWWALSFTKFSRIP